jgi:hypothetical protein
MFYPAVDNLLFQLCLPTLRTLVSNIVVKVVQNFRHPSQEILKYGHYFTKLCVAMLRFITLAYSVRVSVVITLPPYTTK